MAQGFVNAQNIPLPLPVAQGGTGQTNLNNLTLPQPDIVGVTDGSNAAAGDVGELISSVILIGSAVSLTSLTIANVTTISLTAGDWDINAMVGFSGGAATTITQVAGAISLNDAAFPTDNNFIALEYPDIISPALQPQLPTPYRPLSISTTTTVYLIARGVFSGGTLGAFGSIYARRVR